MAGKVAREMANRVEIKARAKKIAEDLEALQKDVAASFFSTQISDFDRSLREGAKIRENVQLPIVFAARNLRSVLAVL